MRVLVVVAHPDDETIGAGILLRRLGRVGVDVSMVHVTDGAPRDLRDAHAAGFNGWEDYAVARREELDRALAVGGIAPSWRECFRVPDQHAVDELVPLARRIASVISGLRPDAVLTHPYEGGHPDHDATAFAVAAASRLADGFGSPERAAPHGDMALPGSPERAAPHRDVFELSSYHFVGGALRTATFLPACGRLPVVLTLTSEERAVKAEMIRCFSTQQRVLRQFPLDAEAIRRAPAYDFTRPPHEGRLFYEHFNWGVDGPSWRERARAALRSLSLG